MPKRISFKIFLVLGLSLAYFNPALLLAAEVRRVPGVPIKGDILLSPAKVELSLNPGDAIVRYVDVVNRTGKQMVFRLEVEDFSSSPLNVVALDKTVDGLNSSLKRYISVDGSDFLMAQGEQAHIPVKISLPKQLPPGGLYAALLVSAMPVNNQAGAARVVTRLGSLFFVRVNGEVKQSGALKSISFANNQFKIDFENQGDIYLDPYGQIEIYNSAREKIAKLTIDPWFVMPRATRTRYLPVTSLSPGSYTATITLNRGYGGITDSQDVNFKYAAAAVGANPISLWPYGLSVILLILLGYRLFI